jgi:hypothetical protein
METPVVLAAFPLAGLLLTGFAGAQAFAARALGPVCSTRNPAVELARSAPPPAMSPAACVAPPVPCGAAPMPPVPPEVEAAEAEALAFRQQRVAGRELKVATRRVNALAWCDDLAVAKAQAAASGKPILWIQGLGDLDGFA